MKQLQLVVNIVRLIALRNMIYNFNLTARGKG